ncbi:MAG: NmrA family NAD(P)-binding protein, partial [Hyphomicrobiales bacterium]
MTILITGASGAVGTPTIRHLVKRGAKIRALTSKESSAANLKSLGVAETVIGDLTSDADIKRAVVGVESVMHIPPRFREDEAEIGLRVLG